MHLNGKHVIVTGASSGIGRALAVELAQRGAVVTAAARRAERLEELAREVADRLPGAPPITPAACDVTDTGQVSWLVGSAVERQGPIDVLINNAGICVYGDVESTTAADFESVMSVNFLGCVRLMLEVLPFMKSRESGLIVNVASVAAFHGVPYLSTYCASKAALVAASQSIRAELDGSGVEVMIVWVPTRPRRTSPGRSCARSKAAPATSS